MLDAGIIEPSSSEWASPIVLVNKKDGTLRLCIDYRRLNAESQMDAYPMPRIDDLIDRLGKAKFITTLDLMRGYWQVPMASTSRHLTAFTTPFGLFQFKVMPFGLQGAPATFQRLMDRVLKGLESYAVAYIDDREIHSRTWGEHLAQVRSVVQRLREAGLTAKPSKCQFGKAQCVYLGHIVGNGMVQPERSKLQGVEAFSTPKTKKEVRCFLGLTGYYRKFIPDYASIAASLTNLTRKTSPNQVVWNERCEASFKRLKDLLCSAPFLQSPDFERDCVLQTDASDVGVGAVLSQVDDMGADHPVAYFSRKLLPRVQKYSTIEKECLAIKLATQAFRVYLLGKPFIVQTDHRALEWLDHLKENNAKLSRWSIALQPFKFEVCHRPGKDNNKADSLSHLPTKCLLSRRSLADLLFSTYFVCVYIRIGEFTCMGSIVRRPTTPCGVPGLCAGEALCVHDNFFCVWLFTIYTVLCCAHLCWSDIKVLCPLAVYVVSGSIVASVGVNPSHALSTCPFPWG